MSKPVFEFDQIIAPISRERFLADYWTKKFLHLSGAKGRFTPLLPWEELNHILEWHPPPQPQLRLFQEGTMVDLRRYIDGPVGKLKLNAGGLITALAQGATMILDTVHEVAPRIADLTHSMEKTLGCDCVANLYAGWRTQKGFEVHWDGHEVFVLQLSGRKRWQVYAPTRLHPLDDDSEKAPQPTAPPIWEGILNDGDLLYLPRGFWHVAYPLDEPSLHVSWGAQPPSAQDFLYWWIRNLRRHPQGRVSLTRMTDPEARKEFVAEMLKFLEDSAKRDPLGVFLGNQEAGRRIPPRLRLPEAPIEQQKPIGSLATRIRLVLQESLYIERDPAEPMAKFFAAGTYWFIRPEFIAAFSRLSGRESVAFQELAATIPDRQLVGMLASALDTLAANGIVFKEEG
ncbi:MAG TPA: cupin domain-containing protein [Rhizomicrobium sp.]|nr:cupin domain-containing protein [Rhizomicrobium sp.]